MPIDKGAKSNTRQRRMFQGLESSVITNLVVPSSIFTVTTSSGVATITLNTQTANTVFAGPASGAAAAPTFRTIVDGDLPAEVVYTDTVQTISGQKTFTSRLLFVTDGGTGTAAQIYAFVAAGLTGGVINLSTGNNNGATLGGAGGFFNLNGGDADGDVGGAGGQLIMAGGAAGSSAGGTGGASGNVLLEGGAGGTSGSGGNGGSLTLGGGTAGTTGTGGNAGNITANGGSGNSTRNGGAGGTHAFSGGNAGSGGAGGAGGSITQNGGNGASGAAGGAAGSITTSGSNAVTVTAGAAGGSIDTRANGSRAGGAINTSAGASAAGGAISTNNGGGAINTAGVGLVEFGVAATRTSLVGSATAARTVTMPDATTTLAGLAVAQTFSANQTINGNLTLNTAGNGLSIREGSNAKMGTATLAAGTVTVNTTQVTANSRVFLTVQSLGTVAVPTPIAVTARTAGTSFTITSSDVTDTSVVAWMIVEPA